MLLMNSDPPSAEGSQHASGGLAGISTGRTI
jgi:hypothetical protein